MSEHAAGVSRLVLIDILDNAQECGALTPGEKETVVSVAADDTDAHVYSERASVMKRLLLHPAFDVTELRVCGTDCDHPPFGARIPATSFSEGAVTGVKGTLPVRYLSIAQSGRQHDYHSQIVSGSVRDNDPRKGEDSD